MKRVFIVSFLLVFIGSCQILQSTQKGSFQERIQRVTPIDIKNHTQKILIQKYGFELQENAETSSSIYLETSWKNVDLTEDEKEAGLENVRVRFKVRSRETRGGPTDEYNVHSLRFVGEVQAYQDTNGNPNWVRTEITPQRRDSLEGIYSDFKFEFDSGNMEFNRRF